jgi:conjugal transfer pilus assembly protein TraL
MQGYNKYYIPRKLDNPPKFLFWTYDTLVLALAPILLGFLFGFIPLGLILGGVAAVGYERLKIGKHAGVGSHTLYWLIGTPSLKGLPPSHARCLVG